MEKPIEEIWKDGFSKNNELLVPKLNDLYHKKSNHIIDKFKRMFKINMIAFFIFSVGVLIIYLLDDMPYLGTSIFLLINSYTFLGVKQLDTLNKIDKSANSYQFLKSFDHWLKTTISYNSNVARYFYPLTFLAVSATVWFDNNAGSKTAENIINNSETYIFFGWPVFWTLGSISIALLMSYFSKALYQWDFNLIFGRIVKKLDKMLEEMEELRR